MDDTVFVIDLIHGQNYGFIHLFGAIYNAQQVFFDSVNVDFLEKRFSQQQHGKISYARFKFGRPVATALLIPWGTEMNVCVDYIRLYNYPSESPLKNIRQLKLNFAS